MLRGRGPSEVGSAHWRFRGHAPNSQLHGIGCPFLSQVAQHHCSRPDLTDRIGDSFSSDIRSGAMDRFEHRRKLPFRIEIRRRSNANRAHYRWSEIRKNVPKKIRSNHDIEPFRMPNKVRGEDINVELVGANVWIFFGYLVKAFIPERHGVNDAVGLRGGGEMLLALPRE